jgi:transposase InsO family protein
MSSLKYQLKELLPSLKGEANKISDPDVKRRFYLIKAVSESPKDVKKTCEARGVSTDYFYKWARRLLSKKTLLALRSISKAPKKFWNQTQKRVEKRIVKLRCAEPFKGPERISFDLKTKFNMVCAASTVAAILKRSGLVKKEYRERLTKKHMKRYRRPWPGYLQMDFKYTPFLINEEQTYQLSVVDHHSSWRFIRQYRDRKIETVLGFLNELEKEVPFFIVQLQTDNAMEFTDKYSQHNWTLKPTEKHELDKWCAERGIEHKLIPIGEKELNGKVENTHRFDDREFFSQNLDVNSFEELEIRTRIYNHRWNNERPTKTLGWKTPTEVLHQAFVRAYVFLKTTLPASAWVKPEPQVSLLVSNGATVTGLKSEIKRLKEELRKQPEKPKKITAVDRYLQYLDWEAKKKIKSWLPVPMILQNFSEFITTLFL